MIRLLVRDVSAEVDELLLPAVRWVQAHGPAVRVSRYRGVVWVAVWRPRSAEYERANLIVRLGRPERLLFTERNQGTRGIPVRWHYALGGRLAVRWEPRPRLPGTPQASA